jgi:glycosyltransferase involved in cell wall biosynthesis
MKRIGIDARLLYQTGVGTYLQNLLLHLAKNNDTTIQFFVYVHPQHVEKVQKLSSHFVVRRAPYAWHSCAEQTLFCLQLMRDHLDLMHFTYFGHPILYPGRFISTIHDVTPLLFATGKSSTHAPFLYRVKHLFFQIVLLNQVKRSAHIIVPTKTVGEQLVDLYGAKLVEKISPLYEGVGYRLLQSQERPVAVPTSYLLYVGNFYPHKNVERLIQAVQKTEYPISLVCAGPHDFFQHKLAHYGQNKKIVFLTSLTQEELHFLYTHALALVHPSLSEGFGLPLIEAAHFQLPIIASDIPVFRELIGDEYYAFNPYETTSIQTAIESFINSNPKKTVTMKPEFSFEIMTARTVSLYNRYA